MSLASPKKLWRHSHSTCLLLITDTNEPIKYYFIDCLIIYQNISSLKVLVFYLSLLSFSILFIFPIAWNHSEFFSSVLFYFFILEREMKKNCNDFSCHLLCINPIFFLRKRRYIIRTLDVLETRYHKKISNNMIIQFNFTFKCEIQHVYSYSFFQI